MPNPFDQSGGGQTPAEFVDKTGAEFLEEFVGEGKKYATVEDAVRGLAHAQHHISVLEHENTQYKSQVASAATVDDIIKRLGQQQQPAADQTPEQTPPSQSSGLTEESAKSLVEQMLQQHSQQQSAQQNMEQVVTALQAKFGDKAGEVWDKAEKQFSVDLDSLAKSSPAAVMRMLGLEPTAPGASAPSMSSTVTQPTQGVRPPEGSKRLVDYLLEKGEIDKAQAYKMRLNFSSDPEKYRA